VATVYQFIKKTQLIEECLFSVGKKKKDDDWLGALLILGGLWLLKEALSQKNVNYFRCWNCNKFLLPNTNPCPYCGVHIDWSRSNEYV